MAKKGKLALFLKPDMKKIGKRVFQCSSFNASTLNSVFNAIIKKCNHPFTMLNCFSPLYCSLNARNAFWVSYFKDSFLVNFCSCSSWLKMLFTVMYLFSKTEKAASG